MLAIEHERDVIARWIDKAATRFVLLRFERNPLVVETFEFTTVERAAFRRKQLRDGLLATIKILNARLAELQQWT